MRHPSPSAPSTPPVELLKEGAVTANLTQRVGSLDLLDFDLIGKLKGGAILPFPFMYTKATRFEWEQELDEYSAAVPARLASGDLREFSPSMDALAHMDIMVACHVQFPGAQVDREADTRERVVGPSSLRLLAVRSGQEGFVFSQQPDDDMVDVHTVNAYDLGIALTGRLPLTQQGKHPRIVVPKLAPRRPPSAESDPLQVRDNVRSSTEVRVKASSVTAFGTIQSHWRTPRKWAPTVDKQSVIWVQIDEDGEYVYASDRGHAYPMTAAELQTRIDRLIVEDIAALRDHRGL